MTSTSSIPRYPLAWPEGQPRTKVRRGSAFKVDFDTAVRELSDEVARLGGKYPVMSTNIPTRLDGTLQRSVTPNDPGVAVYFEFNGRQKVFACDTFVAVKDNVRGIGETIKALRSIERYGASSLLERALTAFDALPAPEQWWQVLGVSAYATEAQIREAHRKLAVENHPDKNGGSGAGMARINAARDTGIQRVRA